MGSVSARAAGVAAVLAWLIPGAGGAQGVVSTARPAPPEAAALQAPVVDGPAVRLDPQQLRSARRLYDLVGASSVAQTERGLTTAMSLQFANAMDDRHEARAKAIVAAVGDGMTSITPQVTDAAVSAIARDFTPAQLRDLLAFYDSPSGQAALRRLPVILRQSTSVMVQYLPQMMAAVEDSYCSRVACSARERKALEAVAARLAAAHPPG